MRHSIITTWVDGDASSVETYVVEHTTLHEEVTSRGRTVVLKGVTRIGAANVDWDTEEVPTLPQIIEER
jgi:hypothetical protein